MRKNSDNNVEWQDHFCCFHPNPWKVATRQIQISLPKASNASSLYISLHIYIYRSLFSLFLYQDSQPILTTSALQFPLLPLKPAFSLKIQYNIQTCRVLFLVIWRKRIWEGSRVGNQGGTVVVRVMNEWMNSHETKLNYFSLSRLLQAMASKWHYYVGIDFIFMWRYGIGIPYRCLWLDFHY